jgi:hypothetical protein
MIFIAVCRRCHQARHQLVVAWCNFAKVAVDRDLDLQEEIRRSAQLMREAGVC